MSAIDNLTLGKGEGMKSTYEKVLLGLLWVAVLSDVILCVVYKEQFITMILALIIGIVATLMGFLKDKESISVNVRKCLRFSFEFAVYYIVIESVFLYIETFSN